LLIILLRVAFFTLFERKVIGLIHSRVGPNKVSFLGLLQPLLDAFKLLAKSQPLPRLAVSKVYYFSPYLSLGFSLILWLTVPFMYASFSINLSLLVFIFVTSLIVFPLLVRG
jgi:NADH-quinone oxidoreductase subunit H